VLPASSFSRYEDKLGIFVGIVPTRIFLCPFFPPFAYYFGHAKPGKIALVGIELGSQTNSNNNLLQLFL